MGISKLKCKGVFICFFHHWDKEITSASPETCLWQNTRKSLQHNTGLHLRNLLPKPSNQARFNTRSSFKRSLTGLNSKFSFSLTSCHTKVKKPSFLCYLYIAGVRIFECIPSSRELVFGEMQTSSFRNWTRFTMSISYNNNYNITSTCKF